MRLLDKYILRNFLVPFLLCFFGFLSIWLVFDLSDNATDFIDGKANAGMLAGYYASQLPQIALISLPVGLVLALLYALSRMSRANEVIAMLTAGQSLGRLLVPLFAVGLLLTGVSTWLNYGMAPHAEIERKAFFARLSEKKRRKGEVIEAHLYRNRADRRTWYVEEMPTLQARDQVLHGIHIVEQDKALNIRTKWYARRARYDPLGQTWRFERGRTVHFDEEGNLTSEEGWRVLLMRDWRENPWRIVSTNIASDGLSVPELREYLRQNADFPAAQLRPYRTELLYRWSLPWGCFVVIFLAAPLGIVYSRRGILAGVAGAIFLFAAHLFLGFLFLALGKGGVLPPFVATWGIHILFLAIGAYLFYLRSTNRELPDLGRWMP